MRNLLWVVLALATIATLVSSGHIVSERLKVFEKGSVETRTIKVEISNPCKPPSPLFIVSPQKPGKYPLLFFVHGTLIHNYLYSDVFQHIASHGFIVVAPQIYYALIPPQTEEIERAATIVNWLVSGLAKLLPEGVEADFTKLAVSGHSRGGKTAFALALGVQKTQLHPKISAVIGVDPVAGTSKQDRTEPHILTYVPNSFDLSVPVTVIGTGLGNRRKFLFGPACAPDEVNHEEFYNECKPECTHFVITKYGHMDMLNDDAVLERLLCVNGKGSDGPMRRTLGGIIVAFLDAYFLHEPTDFATILEDPSLAPTEVYPVESKVYKQALSYAQL